MRLANDQLFVSAATQRSPNFSDQTTTFLEKVTNLSAPTLRNFPQSGDGQFCLFFQKKGLFHLGTHKSVFFSKKVVVWFAKLGLLCVAADTKSWSLASRKAANLLQHESKRREKKAKKDQKQKKREEVKKIESYAADKWAGRCPLSCFFKNLTGRVGRGHSSERRDVE